MKRKIPGRGLILAAALMFALALSACGAGAQSPPPQTPPASGGTDAKIAVMTQEYEGDNIAEILKIEYEGENPEISAINSDISQEIYQRYSDFKTGGEQGDSWMETRAYPFTGDDYLQIVMTQVEYPIYGTDGEIWSYNFDRRENARVLLADVMNGLELTEDALTQRVKELYAPESPSQSVGAVSARGFLILPGGQTQLLLRVTVENSEAEPWDSFYGFSPQTGELLPLNKECLFAPEEMDRMDPPLSYDRTQ
jgi:hypothetical protein